MADSEKKRRDQAAKIVAKWVERNGLNPADLDVADLIETLVRELGLDLPDSDD